MKIVKVNKELYIDVDDIAEIRIVFDRDKVFDGLDKTEHRTTKRDYQTAAIYNVDSFGPRHVSKTFYYKNGVRISEDEVDKLVEETKKYVIRMKSLKYDMVRDTSYIDKKVPGLANFEYILSPTQFDKLRKHLNIEENE